MPRRLMRPLATGVVFAAILVGACPLWPVCGALAQGTPGAAPVSYRIGPADLLRIDVSGRPDISGQYTVGVDGLVTLPNVGAFRAQDRTTTELAADISRRISLVSRDIPQVTITVLQTRTLKIYVVGSVRTPGAYGFSQPPTVWEAIAGAGGPSDDADLSAVQLIPADPVGGEAIRTVDVAAAIRAGTLSSLEKVAGGGTVRLVSRSMVLTGSNVVYIFGAVANQGPQPIDQATDLVTALIRSGPAAEADMDKLEIVRRSGDQIVRMQVSLSDYFGKASPASNPALQPGDTIYCRQKQARFNVFSAVSLVSLTLGLLTSVIVLTD